MIYPFSDFPQVKSTKHRSVIEKRTFVNHTECHCIERSTYNEDTAMANYGQSVVRATILSCTCPKSFEKILQDDGQCRCDCSSGNYDCDWLKRGNEHFAMNDRKWVAQKNIQPMKIPILTFSYPPKKKQVHTTRSLQAAHLWIRPLHGQTRSLSQTTRTTRL